MARDRAGFSLSRLVIVRAAGCDASPLLIPRAANVPDRQSGAIRQGRMVVFRTAPCRVTRGAFMADFVTVAKVGEIPEGKGRRFTAGERRIAVFHALVLPKVTAPTPNKFPGRAPRNGSHRRSSRRAPCPTDRLLAGGIHAIRQAGSALAAVASDCR